jgi:hypothetical protein
MSESKTTMLRGLQIAIIRCDADGEVVSSCDTVAVILVYACGFGLDPAWGSGASGCNG